MTDNVNKVCDNGAMANTTDSETPTYVYLFSVQDQDGYDEDNIVEFFYCEETKTIMSSNDPFYIIDAEPDDVFDEDGELRQETLEKIFYAYNAFLIMQRSYGVVMLNFNNLYEQISSFMEMLHDEGAM